MGLKGKGREGKGDATPQTYFDLCSDLILEIQFLSPNPYCNIADVKTFVCVRGFYSVLLLCVAFSNS